MRLIDADKLKDYRCWWANDDERRVFDFIIDAQPTVEPVTKIETNIFDEEEIHENCTVQILKNSTTGEISVGWWENEKEVE